jgi:hypothetical protein
MNKIVFTLVTFIVFFLVVIGADLVAGRILIRPIPGIRSNIYHHDLIPMFDGELEWGENKYRCVTNSLGFRDEEKRIISQFDPRYRILFLGDSFTEGLGVDFSDSFVGKFWNKIRKEHFEVLNAGVASYSPHLYYLKLKYLLENKKLKIDELIVFIDISDIQDEIVYEDYRPGDNSAGIVDVLKRRSYLFSKIYTRFLHKDPVVERFGRDGHIRERCMWTRDVEMQRLWANRGLELAETYMSLVVDLCRHHGIPLTIAVYPWPYQFEETVSLQQTFWKAFAQRHHCFFLDLFPIFSKNLRPANQFDYFMSDNTHWTVKGHELVADSLFDYWSQR